MSVNIVNVLFKCSPSTTTKLALSTYFCWLYLVRVWFYILLTRQKSMILLKWPIFRIIYKRFTFIVILIFLFFFSKSKIIYRTFNQDCYSKFIGLWWPRTFEQFDRCRCQCWWSTIIRREVVLSRRQQEMELSLELLIQIAPVAHNPQQSLRFPNVRASPPKWPTMYPGFSMGIIKQLVKCPTMPHSMHVQLSKYPSDCQSPIVEQQSMKFDANPRYSKQN